MSIVLLCPSCGATTTYHRPPVTDCARCHQEFPWEMRVTADMTLRQSQTPLPSLLFFGRLATTFATGMSLLAFVLALLNLGGFSINDVQMRGHEFLRQAGVGWAIITASLGAIAYGLWRGRSWVRPLMVAWWANLALIILLFSLRGEGTASDAIKGVVQCAIFSVVAYLYLYRKENVVAYFEAREAPRD